LARPGIALATINTITVHWIGPFPGQTPMDVRAWWIKGPDGVGIQASAHYIIKDDVCMQTIPVDEVAWHCGCAGNYSSIGIEIVPFSKEGAFSAVSVATLKELLGSLPNLPLKRHYDWTKKDCPLYYTPLSNGGEDRWLQLVDLLRS
jgi:N-acetylmuramoyl-L-alanine amidase